MGAYDIFLARPNLPLEHWKILAELQAVQIGDSLEEFLVEATSDQNLRQVMMSLSEAIRTIAFKVMPDSACVPSAQNKPCMTSLYLICRA